MGSEEESVEHAAAARRERLKALRAAQELLRNPDGEAAPEENSEDDDASESSSLNMKFRNYLPHDKQLQESKLAPPVLPKFEDPVAVEDPEEKKEDLDPFVNIAPKKPNWDLRRDVQKRLDKLANRYQKAMFQIMDQYLGWWHESGHKSSASCCGEVGALTYKAVSGLQLREIR